MNRTTIRKALTGVLAGMLVLGCQVCFAESLNPEGVNPHAAAPRKRISEAQKKAAWEAKKKKKAEIEAKRAVQQVRPAGLPANGGEAPPTR